VKIYARVRDVAYKHCIFTIGPILTVNRDNTVGMAVDKLDDRRVGVRVTVGTRLFTSLNHPDRF
jgi:hypothetical protein